MGLGAPTDLAGQWRVRADRKDLGELYPEEMNHTHASSARWMRPDLDDSDWVVATVPGKWPEAADAGEVVWYRRQFSARPTPRRRTWLRLSGIDYFADVWLNDVYVGSHEGYFARFGWEITDLCRDEDDSNLLAIRVHNPRDADGERHELGQLKHYVKGALACWDMNDPEAHPGGIWGAVEVFETGRAALTRVSVQSSPASNGKCDPALRHPAWIDLELECTSDIPQDASVSVQVLDSDGRLAAELIEGIHVGPGSRRSSLHIELPDARLWWTWDLGDAHLYTVHVQLSVQDELHDELRLTTGIRRIQRQEGSSLYLNGHRIFQRGANYLASQHLSEVTAQSYARDVQLARRANLNTMHAFCNVEGQAFYLECDRAGMLVYQDFPIWMTADNTSDLVRRSTDQLSDLIDQFGHHPCIATWNVGSQPSPANMDKLCSALARHARASDGTRVVQHGNTSFSYDRDPTHPTRSFFWPMDLGPKYEDKYDWRFDTHVYAGWYISEDAVLTSVPESHLQLVTEFGAQALPDADALRVMLGDGAYPPDWDAYARHCSQPALLQPHISGHTSLEDMVAKSQDYQSRLLRRHIEFYRTHKFRPCNGAHVFAFVDCWPSISWSILDFERRPKLAYWTVANAMAPTQAFLNGMPEKTEDRWRIRVTLVNDSPGTQQFELSVGPNAVVEDTHRRQGRRRDTPPKLVTSLPIAVEDLTNLNIELEFDPLQSGITLVLVGPEQQRVENRYTPKEVTEAAFFSKPP